MLSTSRVKSGVLNATYSEDVPSQEPDGVGNHQLQRNLGDMEEFDEDEGQDQIDEIVFRRPLLPGAVPKKPALIRTSTLNSESPTKNGKQQDISPPVAYDMDRLARLQEESKFNRSCFDFFNPVVILKLLAPRFGANVHSHGSTSRCWSSKTFRYRVQLGIAHNEHGGRSSGWKRRA